jgi:hypothetical protein
MRRRTSNSPSALAACALVCAALAQSSLGFVKEKQLKPNDARRLIAAIAGEGFSRSAVRVKEVVTTGAEAVAVAGVRTAFRLRPTEEASPGGGKVTRLRVTEVRVGDRRWEDAELVLRALNADANAGLLADVETLAAEFAERERARRGAEREKEAREGQGEAEAKEKKQKEKPWPASEDELTRGAVTVKGLTSMLSATAVEVELELSFRFASVAGKWRVEGVRLAGGEWVELGRLAASLDAEKSRRARAEMEEVGAALEAFRRERGFYVVSDSHVVLVDHLNPRYLRRAVRVDPWHQPYRYAGTRDAYRLTSDGPDGRENTPDDLTLSK